MKRASGVFGIFFGLILFIALSLVPCAASDTANALGADFSDASSGEPVLLSTAKDLTDFSAYVNGGNPTDGRLYKLASDVDLSGSEFVPIGRANASFNGIFDGGGYSVTLSVSQSGDYAGFIGFAGTSSRIENLTVTGEVTGGSFVGGIAGFNGGKIISCVNLASVSAVKNGDNCIGGIAGDNTGVIDACVNAGSVKGDNSAGGVAGRSYGQNSAVTSCVNLGKISLFGAAGFKIGGLIGENAGLLADGYNFASIEATGQRIGSAVGYLVSLRGDSGRIYNVTEGSSRALTGMAEITVPESFAAKSAFAFLSGTELFYDNTLSQPDFGEGYGYMHCPSSLFGSNHISLFQRSLFGDGDGSAARPFTVNTAEEWELFAANTALFGYRDKFIRLDTSVELANNALLSSASVPFNGSFDGGNNRIKLTINGNSYVGLFARIGAQGAVSNLTLNASVTASGDYAGALAGMSEGTVGNISVTGSVTGTGYAGGVAGFASGELTDCENSATVKGTRYVGGIAGRAVLKRAFSLINRGTVSMGQGSAFSYFGGIFGDASADLPFTAEELINKAAVSAYKADNTGGIFGAVDGLSVNGAAATASVSGRNNVGGIAGSVGGATSLREVMVVASVSGARNVGGLVGNGASAVIDGAYFSGILGEVAEAAVDRNTFRTIAPRETNLSDVFYNGDLIFSGTDGTGVSAVALTEGIFDGGRWLCLPKERGAGYFPVLTDDKDTLTGDTEIMSVKLRYEYFGGGRGTEDAPYLIAEEQHLRNLSYLVKGYEEYRGLSYAQSAEISLARPFESIGKTGFAGTYDGGYYALNNLCFIAGDGALFGTLSGGASVVRVAIESGFSAMSGIAVSVEQGAKVEYCYSLAVIEGGGKVGGLVVENRGEIRASFFAGRITGAAGAVAGGIAAENHGEITECFSSGYCASDGAAGGIAGRNYGLIGGCVASGTTNGTLSSAIVGGLAGITDGGEFIDCIILSVITTEGRPPLSSEKTGAIAGFAENSLPAVNGKVSFNGSYAELTAAYHYVGGHADAAVYRSTSADMLANGFDLSFASYGFGAGLVRDKDSDYAPRPSVFVNTGNARVEAESAFAVKIRLFGWDNASEEKWGAEGNPYLIEEPSQLTVLSELASAYDYAGAYFLLTGDLDMTAETMFRPIGRYSGAASANNRVFNGIFDGNGYTIEHLTVSEAAGYGYVGLFGYTGASFVLKGLTLANSCAFISGGSYAGSFAGFNGGKIIDCISYASVTAQSYVGGIAAASANGTTISNTVFAGVLADVPNAYGITSQAADTVAFDALNTWYIVGSDGSFVQAGREKYVHNDYGSVLFVDRGGRADAERTATGFVFRLFAEEYYTGILMTAQDGALYTDDGKGFDPMINAGVSEGRSVKFYARFTLLAEADFENAEMENLLGAEYGRGYYYRGQSVRFTFAPIYGYFVDDDAEYGSLGAVFSNEQESLTMLFPMPEGNAGVYRLPVAVRPFAEYGEIVVEEGEELTYDGGEKTVSVVTNNLAQDKFGEFGVSFYFGEGLGKVNGIKDAGDYTVKVQIYLRGKDFFVGVVTKSAAVSPARLSPSEGEEYWRGIASKVYDGSALTSGIAVSNDFIEGITAADRSAISVSVTVEWNDAAAGSDKTARIFDFAIVGAGAFNYRFDLGFAMQLTGCEILKKSVGVTVPESGLSGRYTGNRPAVTGALSASIGDAAVVWSFHKLASDGTRDEEWNALPVKTWNTGRYELNATCSDENNYELTLQSEYVYVILPRIVTDITFTGHENLIYDGSSLADGIRGYFSTVNGGAENVSFEFYRNGALCNDVLNAGRYEAKPIINNVNYEKDVSVGSLTFEVARSPYGGEITFTLADDKVVFGEKIAVGFTCEVYDATLTAEAFGPTRGRAELEFDNGQYYLVPTKYSADGRFSFFVKASDSENYEDRSSRVTEIGITAGSIYAGLAESARTLVFGEAPSLELIYSFDREQNIPADIGAISGFSPPAARIEAEELRAGGVYIVGLYGGDSDGYRLYASDNCSLTVVKRKIRIVVTAEQENGKIYGEEDGEIGYVVLDAESGQQLTVLPDGREPGLRGAPGRSVGENAGKYAINAGTLTEENNPDYSIETAFYGEFEIKKRNIELVVDAGQKEYGTPDPFFTFSPSEGFGYAFDDGAESLTVVIGRYAGEDVGGYAYSVTEYSGGENYAIDRIDNRSNRFLIVRARPVLTFDTAGEIRYGDQLRVLTIDGSAFAHGEPVKGTFSWSDGSYVPSATGAAYSTLRFEPDSSNYESVVATASYTVLPRIAEVIFGGNFEYVYNGGEQCNITASVVNPVGDDSVTLTVETSETPINAGTYVFRVTMDEVNYVLENGKAEKTFVIYRKVVRVALADAVIGEGDAYSPEISYDGFADGENESVLRKRAAAGDIPSAGGIYFLTPSGAEAENYTFVYVGASLIIKKKALSAENVSVKGDLPPEAVLAVSIPGDDGMEYHRTRIDKALKFNVLLPNPKKLSEYYELSFGGRVTGELTYTVKLKFSEGDKLYLVMYDGSVKELTDYEVSETALAAGIKASADDDGYTEIVFTSEQAAGIAVYGRKGTAELLTGYLPLAALAAGFVVVILIVVLIAALKRRAEKRKAEYVKRYRR